MEPTENFLDTPDGRIHYLDWGGSGPQAHLLHANGFCAGTYSPFVFGLGSGHSNISKNREKTPKNTSISVLIGQFSCKNWPIKDGGL